MSIIFQTIFNILRKKEQAGKDGATRLDEDLKFASGQDEGALHDGQEEDPDAPEEKDGDGERDG